jgi:parvulin-like peptidyl-prolyl isomerase
MFRIQCLVFSLVALTLFNACSPKPGDPDYVVAQVADKKITQQELDENLNRHLDQISQSGQEVTEEMRKIIEWRTLDELVMKELIVAAAKSSEIDLAQIEQEAGDTLARIKEQAPDPAAFAEQIAQQGMTEDIIKNEIYIRNLLEALMKNRYPDGHAVSEEEAKAFYEQNKQMFNQPERVTARHILVRVNPEASKEEKDGQKKKIDEARNRIAKGEDFAEVAKEVSEDPGSGSRGGMLPPFTRGQMVPPFEEAAFEGKKGKLSDVFETQFGYHFLEVLDRSEAKQLTFDDVKLRLNQQLERRAEGMAAQELLKEIEDSVEHEVFIEDPSATPPAPSPDEPPAPEQAESSE